MARRALVVDDSRSARAFLTRILERYELAVDAVESAEQAIEYLRQQRPDVIFMDHLMPGMDGFQAVQAIKNNPRTATIPIMMYTSQEGELYLSQARALGAIGVLPKQIKPADVSKALERLNLRPDGHAGPESAAAAASPAERSAEHPRAPLRQEPPPEPSREPSSSAAPGRAAPLRGAAERAAADSGPPAQERRSPDRPDAPTLPPELRTIMEAMLAHHGRELRRFVVDNLETQADRILGDMKLLLQDAVPEPLVEPSDSLGRRLTPWLAAAALIVAALFGVLWWQRSAQSTSLAARLASSELQLADAQRALQAAQASARAFSAVPAGGADETRAVAAGSGTSAPTSVIEPVPFGEMPLGGARLERVSQLLSRLTAQGFQGVVQIRSIPGRYCMIDGPGGQPILPTAATAYSKCDEVGTPREDDGSPSARQSIAFADMIATARAAAKFDIQVSAGSVDEVAVPYPSVTDALTAGEWNRIAAANNRVELSWRAASP